jgi:protease IV
MLFLHLSSLILAAPTVGAEAVALPTDVSGYAIGADAAAFDPAAPRWADGLELQVRSRFVPEEAGESRIGLYGVVPTRVVVPYLGLDWLLLHGARHERLTLGLALPLGSRLSLGVAYRGTLSPRPAYDGGHAADLGLSAQLSSWLSLSAGIDGIGRPTPGGVRQPILWRAGGALRPWVGAPWLTIGGDLRFATQPYDLVTSRLFIDLGTEGLHGVVTYEPKDTTIWLGLSLALFGVEVRGALVPANAAFGDSGRRNDMALSATLRNEPRETLLDVYERTVELTLDGDLEPKKDGLFSERPKLPDQALTLAALADDPHVGTVILTIGELEVGLATVDELRRAIHALRESGKTVIAELTEGDDKSYMVAAAADRIRMDPAASLRLDGFAVTRHYFADALEKLGIKVEAVAVGKYKSAPDALTRSSARPEDLEVEGQVLAQAFLDLSRVLVNDRHLSQDKVVELVTRGGFRAEEALQAGLVDELTQPVDPERLPVGRVRGEEADAVGHPSRCWGPLPAIAVVPVVGTIIMRAKDNPLPGDSAVASEIIEQIDEAVADADVKGIVLRIDSGGGDVYAAEMIWRAVRRAVEYKPLVVSMGDVAASGGYYIAAPAKVILAEANTITGSIGIFTLKFDLSGLFNFAGINTQVYKEGENADWDRLDSALTPVARERLQHIMQTYYDTFVGRVAAGRKLSPTRVREIAEGRVYTGEQALSLKLVDGIGGLSDAIREAAADAGVLPGEDWTVRLPQRRLSVSELARNMTSAQTTLPGVWQELWRRAQALDERPLMLMPMELEVGR